MACCCLSRMSMLVCCRLVCTGWVLQKSFVAACQLSALIPLTLPESLDHNSFPYSWGCIHVPRSPLQAAIMVAAGLHPPGLLIRWHASHVISLMLLP